MVPMWMAILELLFAVVTFLIGMGMGRRAQRDEDRIGFDDRDIDVPVAEVATVDDRDGAGDDGRDGRAA